MMNTENQVPSTEPTKTETPSNQPQEVPKIETEPVLSDTKETVEEAKGNLQFLIL